jgi:Penicillin-insensitive murein endopeptidase
MGSRPYALRMAARLLALAGLAALIAAGPGAAFLRPISLGEERPGARTSGVGLEPDRDRRSGAPRGDPRRAGSGAPEHRTDRPIRWRSSVAIGLPEAGRLQHGVKLPAEGRHYFTWDPILKRQPNRGWRRWGTDELVRTTPRVIREFARAHPGAPRIGVGDLSRPHGGDFGPRYGYPGHASHQNGLDVDIYYPLQSGAERAPLSVDEVDRRLSQDLVDRFVDAGAVKVFVGPSTGLTGPPGIVEAIPYHDNHLHVRISG